MTTEMKALIVRIEAGETGREIDALAFQALQPERYKKALASAVATAPKDLILPERHQHFVKTHRLPAVSTSLDAITALTDEILPQASWKFIKQRQHSDSFDTAPTDYSSFGASLTDYSSFDAYCEASTECGVRLACLLKAFLIKLQSGTEIPE